VKILEPTPASTAVGETPAPHCRFFDTVPGRVVSYPPSGNAKRVRAPHPHYHEFVDHGYCGGVSKNLALEDDPRGK
jgi:hypothetical protein